jgi:5-methyltetrahydropteroyltriglutamate--homocysteine methyltransferase
MENPLRSHSLGFPRIGEKRELKKATEAFWAGKFSAEELRAVGADLRRRHWQIQRDAGIDLIPSNDFSFYDQMLDMTCLLGCVPPRFGWAGGEVDLALYFKIARGILSAGHDEGCECGGTGATTASEMTKWFDTNYHYIVPEFHEDTVFKLSATKPFDEFTEAMELGIKTKPVLIGPVSYLYLGKAVDAGLNRLSLLESVLPVYGEILARLAAQGAEWVQLDEPVLTLDLAPEWRSAFLGVYQKLRAAAPGLKIMLGTYFGELRENLPLAASLPVDVLHFDVTRAGHELDALLDALPAGMELSLGIVDGRNIWRNDFERSKCFIDKAKKALGVDRLWIAPSCSLLHSPVTLRHETELDTDFKSWLAFAEEKLVEVVALARLGTPLQDPKAMHTNQVAVQSRRVSERIHRKDVKVRCAAVSGAANTRQSPFSERRIKQHAALRLPEFPTTTIGSFPQTADVRKARLQWKKGELSPADYQTFLEERTAECVKLQEEIGIDVLVHGEFERNDMVEYFGEQLDGFAFTANGWVQSYGSRCVKPPVIFGDVARARPMTVEWSKYAQSLTDRPMKGMLTGPITILQWSFVRDDQPRSETARQIGFAIRDEVIDLEAAGIRVIQIDEPALREGLPLRRSDWEAYLDWATEAFRISASGVRDETQIHTHMCYCEFNDIIDSIAALDADVISIETSRSNMELLGAFATFKYPNEVGPGVWDIHSPRVPSIDEMADLLTKASDVLPVENLWVNPDCGLKTRGWEETKSALQNMISAARRMRERFLPASH